MIPKKSKTLLAALIFSITLFTNCSDEVQLFHTDITRKGELVVAVDSNIPYSYTAAGEDYGRHSELLRQYADQLGVKLRVLEGLSRAECERMLRTGEIDIIAGITAYNGSDTAVIPVRRTCYALLAKRGVHAQDDLSGKRVLISSGFKTSKFYNPVMDSLSSARKFVTETGGAEMGATLRDGDYDYLICERNDAILACGLYSGIGILRNFDEEICVDIVLNTGVKGLKDDFRIWLSRYAPGSDATVTDNKPRGNKCISDYDDVIRSVARKQGLDWRLLSAIAYHESRFDTHVVSNRGARGLMQIMPVVARHFGVPHDKIADPLTNVMLAARLLKNIEKSLQLPVSTPAADRMGIVLACYNAGVGHIADARRLAMKYGSDANSWADVSSFLHLKSQPEYYGDEVVCNGIFRSGRQTTAFVNGVIGKYNSYCLIASR